MRTPSRTYKVLAATSPGVPETTLHELLERNARHTASLPKDYFSAVQTEQRPAAVSICCSDSRVSQEGMWAVDEPGWLFTPSTIGNQVWDREAGERFVDGGVLYPMRYTETDVTLVVGHTGCGAVSAALDAVLDRGADAPRGVAKRIDLLAPVVEAGLRDDHVDPDRGVDLVNQLVEFNVDRQVAFLLESEDVPDEEAVFGFVYDFQGAYGDVHGRAYLVNANGETGVDALRAGVPEAFAEHVHRLL